jgi:hypothetical protein
VYNSRYIKENLKIKGLCAYILHGDLPLTAESEVPISINLYTRAKGRGQRAWRDQVV